MVVGDEDGGREKMSKPMRRRKTTRSSSPADGESEMEELAPSTPITPPGTAPVLGVRACTI